MTALTARGASLAALADAAARLGARAAAVRMGADQLRHATLPAVPHLRTGHYVTLFEVRGPDAVVGDPACGVEAVPLADFTRGWSGNLLLIHGGGAACLS
ncbi:MAG: cysteine peptidase family C39 domain-containing protein [Gemmataceae bacterium]